MFSRTMRRTAAFAAATVTALSLMATQSSAAGSPHVYTPRNAFYQGHDPRGNFTAQIKYDTGKFQMGWQLSAATAALATGPMNETANLTCNGRRVTHDSHAAVGARYFLHMSSSLGRDMTRCNWELRIHETFPIGHSGTRTVDVDFPFVVTLV
ncbi:hypothetical protein ACFVU0_07545 [Streptomyces sp. NPDC058122]|uniref:hypothetical protein n=1 Tax=Streptomyces sp. NPDC058122 TaxID=3346349 RepID=UPI0036E76EC8